MELDREVVVWLNDLVQRSGVLDAFVSVLAQGSPYIVALIAALLIEARRTAASVRSLILPLMMAFVAAVVVYAINRMIGWAWDRQRPFVAHPGAIQPTVEHAADASFPSDYAALAAVGVVSFLRAVPWIGVVLAPFAILICVCRVAAGLHYPTDVIAGLVLGSVVALGLASVSIPQSIRRRRM